jgi:hypothetical protein
MEGAQPSSPNACMRPQKPLWHSTGSEKAQSVITIHGASMPLLRFDFVIACGIGFQHMECCRWAMLAAAGILFVDLLGHLGAGGPAAATPWFKASDYTYFAPTSTLFIVELILFAWVEVRRYQDMMKPGRCAAAPKTHLHKLTTSNFSFLPAWHSHRSHACITSRCRVGLWISCCNCWYAAFAATLAEWLLK